MLLDDWAEEGCAHYEEDTKEWLTYRSISSLLKGISSPDEVAETVIALFEPFLSADTANHVVWNLWAIVAGAARNFGHVGDFTERLISLLKSISNRSKVNEDGIALTVRGQTYWRDLPGFYFIFGEHCMDWDFDGSNAKAAGSMSGTTFAATFFKAGGTEMESYITTQLRNGVEAPLHTHEDVEWVHIDLPPAALWVLIAGDDIYEYCRKDKDRAPPTISNFLWKGDLGYSLERWAFWKQRFDELSHEERLHLYVQSAAVNAYSKMTIIESRRIAGRGFGK